MTEIPGAYRAYLSLGSNQGDPEMCLAMAHAALARIPGARLEAVSGVYITEPLGCEPGTPWFHNQAARIQCLHISPMLLLRELHRIENILGRVRQKSGGARLHQARTMDLDIVSFGKWEWREPDLIVPHPRMRDRAFVLLPLREVAGQDAVTPDGETADGLLSLLDYSLKGNQVRQNGAWMRSDARPQE